MSEALRETRERRVLGTELLWAFGVGVLVAATIGMILFTALTEGINPPSNVERIDPKTLHLSGEFAEQNLGTVVSSDGAVTAGSRAVGAESAGFRRDYLPDSFNSFTSILRISILLPGSCC